MLGDGLRAFRASAVGLGTSESCSRLLEDISCLLCNPYAAHALDVERSGAGAAEKTAEISARSVPGICRHACFDLYRQCGGRVLSNFFSLPGFEADKAAVPSRDEFCGYAVMNNSVYCYPNILHLDRERVDQPPTSPGPGREGPSSKAETDCLCVEEAASGLINPVALVPAKDGTRRLFIVEQGGRVYILNGRQLKPEPYLDISKVVGGATWNRRGDERGMLGLDFHPQFSANQRLVVSYNVYVNRTLLSRIAELRQSPTNPDRADHNSERVLLEVEQPESNHNGGQVTFGPDGYLYVFLGDGGGAGDPHGALGNGQDLYVQLTIFTEHIAYIQVVTRRASAGTSTCRG